MKVVCSLLGVCVYIYIYILECFSKYILGNAVPVFIFFDEQMTLVIFLLMINCKHIKESIMKVSVAIVKLKMLFKIFSFT